MIKSSFLLFFQILGLAVSLAQQCPGFVICGATNVSVGQTQKYRYTDDAILLNARFVLVGGRANTPVTTREGITYVTYLTFTTNGSTQLQFRADGLTTKTLNITVGGTPCLTPTIPPGYFNISPVCGGAAITYTLDDPGGLTDLSYYWQTIANGTETISPGLTYTAASAGDYYLRAKRSSGDCWSLPKLVTVQSSQIYSRPALPPTPSVSTNTCGPKTLTKPTAPAGVTFYWQGTNPGGLSTDGTASAATYLVSSTNTYYLNARDNSNQCWSENSRSINVATIQTPTPPNGSKTVCQWDNILIQGTTLLQPGETYKWYNTSNTLLHTGTSYSPANLFVGQYTYRIKKVSVEGCESDGYGTVTVNVNTCDDQLNWRETTSYGLDASGNQITIGKGKAYSDGFGNVLQTQSKSLTSNAVLAAHTVYDHDGAPALTTLPAPINSANFGFRYKFITNTSNAPYRADDFDKRSSTGASGERDNPVAVANGTIGTLGWYYSSNNTLEPLNPTTSYPYARQWAEQGPDPKSTISAGPGNNYRMGSGHEVKSERFKITAGELTHYYAIRTHFIESPNSLVVPANPGYKYISTDPDGKKSVVFVDADGRSLASAQVMSTNTSTNPPTFTYNYWSYVFYNDLGQIVAEVAPQGVVIGNNSPPQFVTKYTYDFKGRRVEVTSPDDGTTQYLYSDDGKIRFSQTQKQRNGTPKRFSYTNYDYLGRLIESGEYESSGANPFVFEPYGTATPAARSVLLFLESIGHVDVSRKVDTRCRFAMYSEYDKQPQDFPSDASHNAQTFLYGQVSKTQRDDGAGAPLVTTWYSYDEFGQLRWTKQDVPGLGHKTIDYIYDFVGNVVQVGYQIDNAAERFYHHYTYDADQRLQEVRTSKDGTNKTLHAVYKYYLHGPLKRVELATNKQGIDYVYTITGSLKAINHADPDKDPGLDGIGGPNASFARDAFGETLVYHDNDYAGAGYDARTINTNTYFSNNYDGKLKATAYHNSTEYYYGSHQKRIFGYNYDQRNQLVFSILGKIQLNGAEYSTTLESFHREDVQGYDKNGNITGLLRKDNDGTVVANYTYVYEPNTNRLDKVNNYAALLADYTYNADGQMTQKIENGKTYNVTYTPYGLTDAVRDAGGKLLQSYHYDDGGSVYKKVLYNVDIPVKNTFYVQDAGGNPLAVYEQSLPGGPIKLIELPIYGAGRIGMHKPQANAYFYEVTDHLGSMRAVIGLPETETFTATMETENSSSEQPPFTNISATRATYNNANKTPGGNEAARLNKNKPAGPAIMIPVSAGDVVNMQTWAYYEKGSSTYPNVLAQATIINAIASAFGGVSGAPGDPGKIWNNVQNGFDGVIYQSSSSSLPSAFLTYVFFDLNFVPRYYGSRGVTAAGNLSKELLQLAPLTIDESGYIYACVYNWTDHLDPVYFDDFQVSIAHSPIVAGADYYPFGLVMDGREIRDEPYRYGYQGQYSEKNDSIGWNEFDLRMYDARIGRWLSADPYGQFTSPYLAMGNNPTISIDPTGGISIDLDEVVIRSTKLASGGSVAAKNLVEGAIMFAGPDKCDTCPSGKEYDNYRNSNLVYNYYRGASGDGVYQAIPEIEFIDNYSLMPAMNMLAKFITHWILFFDGAYAIEGMGVGMRTAGKYAFARYEAVEAQKAAVEQASISNLRNGHLAGQSHPKTGVPFDKSGYPDFSKNLYKGGPSDVMIKPTGNRVADFAAANSAAGYTSTPKGFTWHHHQTTGRMQLVETTIHSQTGHTGGFSLWRF